MENEIADDLETRPPEERQIWTHQIVKDRIANPFSPFMWTFFNRIYYTRRGDIVDAKTLKNLPYYENFMGRFFGRIYVNVTQIARDISQSQPGMERNEIEQFLLGEKGFLIPKFKIRTLFHYQNLKLLFVGLRIIFPPTKAHKQWEKYLPSMLEDIKNFDRQKPVVESINEYKNYFTLIENSLIQKFLGLNALTILYASMFNRLLSTLTEKWIGKDDENMVARLTTGSIKTKVMEANMSLMEISQKISKNDKVKKIFFETETTNIYEKLKTKPEAKEFIEDFENFLNIYGHFITRLDLMLPCWRDNPNLVLDMIKSILSSEEKINLTKRAEERINEAEEIYTKVIKQISQGFLQKILPFKKLIFKKVIELARVYSRLKEDQRFYACMLVWRLRRCYLDMGEILVKKGFLNNSKDIFFLTESEIDLINQEKVQKEEILKIVERRKITHQKQMEMIAPDIIVTENGKIVEEKMKSKEKAKILKGIGASAGITQGKAKIILSPEFLHELKEGEILVTRGTDPCWTPIFSIAKGLVMDGGGMLSHGAIVAREFGIPAVVGTSVATTSIKNGQTIEVDGNKGEVHIL